VTRDSGTEDGRLMTDDGISIREGLFKRRSSLVSRRTPHQSRAARAWTVQDKVVNHSLAKIAKSSKLTLWSPFRSDTKPVSISSKYPIKVNLSS